MIDDVEFYGNIAKMDAAYYDAKEFFQEHKPYTEKYTLSGSVYVFNTHFTTEALESFNTDNLKYLSLEERTFLLLFIEWQNFLLADPENPIAPGSVEDTFVSVEKAQLEAFNNWLIDELAGTPHPEV